MDKIKAGFMTQLYRDVSSELKLTVNNSVLEEMETKNKEELEKLTRTLHRLYLLMMFDFHFSNLPPDILILKSFFLCACGKYLQRTSQQRR